MFTGLDDKQKRLIEAWFAGATTSNGDEYGRFMSAWIAFNAFCYARFADKASRRRPDLSEDKGLSGISGQVPAKGTLELRSDGRVRLRIEKPGRIQIDIRERYTEDIVFAEFSREYSQFFTTWLLESPFCSARDEFLASLKRSNGYYVINMLRVAQYDEQAPIGDLSKRNVVVAITEPNDLGQLVDALYQVRCNVFHGEKVPGDLNDDRIVKAARPLLVELLRHLI
ncbi:hypothetical protein [Desulfofustis limnaeus]|uniref:Apea-like HEPN domain-containing protein n=1 Tax=Desulfofustis limnaeus TaxID=2740163 RepID=A0ABN6M8I7_9BACT|nr:hypothetical protein [Desulfofustis limnaeus]BDD89194.1 hypothetical protein DPPLL_35590 [Desulfofustis limnaeus]